MIHRLCWCSWEQTARSLWTIKSETKLHFYYIIKTTASWAESPSVRIDLDTHKWWHHEKTVEYLLFIRYDQNCPRTTADILRFHPQSLWYFTSKIRRNISMTNCVTLSKYLQSSQYLFLSVCSAVTHPLSVAVVLSPSSRWCIKKQ